MRRKRIARFADSDCSVNLEILIKMGILNLPISYLTIQEMASLESDIKAKWIGRGRNEG